MKTKNILFRKLNLFLLCLIFSSVSATAQISETSLRGTVTDDAGNIIVASAVVAQNEATAQVTTTTTNGSGDFVFASLPPGNYTIFVRVPGFKTFELKNLKLNVGQTWQFNIKL